MLFNILNRFTGSIQLSIEIEAGEDTHHSVKLGLAVKAAIKSRADLYGADLYGADLYGADLYGANLTRADLTRADLYGADLYGADLYGANLTRADLTRANLTGANLTRADLTRADLYGADLYGADLYGADLYGADLYGANLTRANLTGANLTRANLTRANLTRANLTGANLTRANLTRANLTNTIKGELAIARTRILGEGQIIGWKKCAYEVVVKLSIPAEAKRSHAWGRKCRAEFADVLEVHGSDHGISLHDGTTRYEVGKRMMPDRFEEDWKQECAPGIHFFITREEAEAYN